MDGDFDWWSNYLTNTLNKIEGLINNKKEIYADFHIHTDYSADGKQTLEEILYRTSNLGLDIIAITDHDSIGAFKDLYNIVIKNKQEYPIVIPGIEFTVENNDYGSQCHILQLMINPKEKSLIENVKYNEKALWKRIDKQFERISKNEALQYYINQKKIICNKIDYKEFLKTLRRPIPEYNTIMMYIQKKIIEKNISNWDIFKLLEESNEKDECKERKDIKRKRYEVLKERYKYNKESNNSLRFLHSMLAVKGADDDDFPNYECKGCLSVNYFGELKVEELNKKYLTFVAHPSQEKLDCINKLIELNNNICGIEYNKQCKYTKPELFFSKVRELNLLKIVGSDSHSLDSEWYNDLSFYHMDKNELKKFTKKGKEYAKKLDIKGKK